MSSVEQLLNTPLHAWHVANSGRMVDFAGWSMPVQYTSIIQEHEQTRNAIGMFDVSHMGRLFFSGTGVGEFLDSLTTRQVAGVDVGKIRYSLMAKEDGCILDDVLVYYLPSADGTPFHMMVVNASNREKIVSWINSHIPADSDIVLDDRTESTAMIAVQGPKANAAVATIAAVNPDELPYYTGTTSIVNGYETIISRTGYTGEDGCELIVDGEYAAEIWAAVYDLASEVGGGATGLAARDTLRLEAAMPLYGHELSESTNVAQTGLRFAVQMKNRSFIGRKAILAGRKDESLPVRIGLQLDTKRVAREECGILVGGTNVGTVTSGTFAPTLQKSIAMGYINKEHSASGTTVQVDIRGKTYDAQIVDLPFYDRNET